MRFRIPPNHEWETETIRSLRQNRSTNKTAPVRGHEINHLRRDFLSGTDEIAFILTILVINDNDKLTGADVCDDFLDGAKRVFRFRHGIRRRGRISEREC